MSQIRRQLSEQRRILRRSIAGHLRWCEECQDSLQEERPANCLVGHNLVVRIAQITQASAETEKLEIEGRRVTRVVFASDRVILCGEDS